MQHFSRYGWWSAALVTMVLLAVAGRPRTADSLSSPRPIEDWNMLDLVEYLSRMGVELQLRSTQEDGSLGQSVFLTTAGKRWRDLNNLNKDAKRIREWQGVIYCERMKGNSAVALRLYGDHCLVVEPFVFYGDAELLRRIQTALAPVGPPAAS